MTPRSSCDSRPLLAAGRISHASRSTLKPHTPVESTTRVQDVSCDLSLPCTEMAVTGTPWQDQSSWPARFIRFPPSADPVHFSLPRRPFAFGLTLSMTETRCRQSARKPRWPDSLAAPPRGESLTGYSLRINALD